MLSAANLLWVSIKPLLKMVITVLFGFWLTKRDLFGGIAARGAGQVIINVTIPCLLFSKIVPSFNPENISALGPLVLIGSLYQVIGLGLAFTVRQFFWVPHRFRYGILAAGTWGNWSDIPTAVIMSITAAAPFGGQADSDLAVAYISVFILIFYGSLFPLGGHLLIGRDFKGPDYADDEVRMSFSAKVTSTRHQLSGLFSSKTFKWRSREQTGDIESTLDVICISEKKDATRTLRQVTFAPEDIEKAEAPIVARDDYTDDEGLRTAVDTATPSEADVSLPLSSTSPTPEGRLHTFLRIFWIICTPPTIAIILSFPTALIAPVKRLFISSSSAPPLGFLLDTATFVGAASVPLGLICLGSALGRMTIPKPWTRLPLGAISAFTFAKLVLMPVFGIGLCSLFTYTIPLIPVEDKVLRYVCMFFSSVPTATAQVFLTQVYSPDGSAEHLSAFLVPQYALVVFTMTAVNAYALSTLFS